jgi:hypothetical protein
MSEAVEARLRGFATELIERNGGLVEWPNDSDWGQAILTPELARRQGVDEMLRLCSRPDDGGLCVSLASDFLDAAELWLEAVPRFGAVQVSEAYLKRGDLGEAVAKSFTWLNAKVRVGAGEPTRIKYQTWWFRVLLTSEDRWESQLATTVNPRAAVEVDFPDPLQLWELKPSNGVLDFATSYETAVAAAERHIQTLAAGFFGRMDARLERDRRRLSEYYNALRREADQKRQRARTTAAPDQADDADRAVTLELRRKLAELEERYAIHATLRPLIVIQTELPVLEVRLVVHRKQATREYAIYWNPLTKSFDPIRCTACGRGAFSLAFSNDRVDALCARCSR